MKIYAIGDLHISKSGDKPMDIFGALWKNHDEQICNSWSQTVSDDDIVLIPGDLSWAMRLDEAAIDLDCIMRLPGHKVFIRGNHDYWWSSISKVRTKFAHYENAHFLQNDSVTINGIAFAGTRGWLCPQSSEYKKEKDEPLYNRELFRLEMSLKSMEAGIPRILLLHFPPLAVSEAPTGFTDLAEKFHINNVVYGHLHGNAVKSAFEGNSRGVQYNLCSSDYIGFAPREIQLNMNQ